MYYINNLSTNSTNLIPLYAIFVSHIFVSHTQYTIEYCTYLTHDELLELGNVIYAYLLYHIALIVA